MRAMVAEFPRHRDRIPSFFALLYKKLKALPNEKGLLATEKQKVEYFKNQNKIL